VPSSQQLRSNERGAKPGATKIEAMASIYAAKQSSSCAVGIIAWAKINVRRE
jgi:hypothetical protein